MKNKNLITRLQFNFLEAHTETLEQFKNILYAYLQGKVNDDFYYINNLTEQEKNVYIDFINYISKKKLTAKLNGRKNKGLIKNQNAKKKAPTITQIKNKNEMLKLVYQEYLNYKHQQKHQHPHKSNKEIFYILKATDKEYIDNTLTEKLANGGTITTAYLKKFISILPTITQIKKSHYGDKNRPFDYMTLLNNKYNYLQIFIKQHSHFKNEKLY